ncbi:MAG: dienelactone hydrolase family protein [Trebonia sp.]
MTTRIDVEIPVPDGVAKGTLHVPDGEGPWPAVLVFPDAGGYREVMKAGFGDRLASMGYVALSPDVFYRAGDWAPFDISTVFSDEKERGRLFGLMGQLTNERVIADARAYADFLLSRPEVGGAAIGTTGYCMGGRLSLVAAGGLGGKIGAAASFHGGNLAAADNPSSPHLAAGQIKATVYVAGAIEDNSYPAEQAERLEGALTVAGVDHKLETYQAHHGFAVPDNSTYDKAADDRHWEALATLYGEHLRSA